MARYKRLFAFIAVLCISSLLLGCNHSGANVSDSFAVPEGKVLIDVEEYQQLLKYKDQVLNATTAPADLSYAGSVDYDYIANKNTKKFHYPYCNSVDQMKESNKWYFSGSRDELIEKGYKPCKNCNP